MRSIEPARARARRSHRARAAITRMPVSASETRPARAWPRGPWGAARARRGTGPGGRRGLPATGSATSRSRDPVDEIRDEGARVARTSCRRQGRRARPDRRPRGGLGRRAARGRRRARAEPQGQPRVAAGRRRAREPATRAAARQGRGRGPADRRTPGSAWVGASLLSPACAVKDGGRPSRTGSASSNGSSRSVRDGSCGCVAQLATIATSAMPLKPVQTPGGMTTSE